MFRFSLTTNDVQAWTRTRKSVFLRTLGRSNSVCLYIGVKIHADSSCTNSMKNKIQRGWYFYSGFLFCCCCFSLLHNCHCKTTPLHLHPVLHPLDSIAFFYIRSAVVLLELPAYAFSLSSIPMSDSILAKDITLDRDGRNRRSLRPCFDIVNCFLSSECGLLYHHLWSETRQTGYSMGVTIRLEPALDLVKKMERANERHWREPRGESILKKFPKPSR